MVIPGPGGFLAPDGRGGYFPGIFRTLGRLTPAAFGPIACLSLDGVGVTDQGPRCAGHPSARQLGVFSDGTARKGVDAGRVRPARMAGGPGFEPGLTESESVVLPLDDPPEFLCQYRLCQYRLCQYRLCQYSKDRQRRGKAAPPETDLRQISVWRTAWRGVPLPGPPFCAPPYGRPASGSLPDAWRVAMLHRNGPKLGRCRDEWRRPDRWHPLP
jgi:hypothetical protein